MNNRSEECETREKQRDMAEGKKPHKHTDTHTQIRRMLRADCQWSSLWSPYAIGMLSTFI